MDLKSSVGGGFYIMAVVIFMTSACLGWEKLAVVNLNGNWCVGSSTAFHHCFQQGQLGILCELALLGFDWAMMEGQASIFDVVGHERPR